MITSAPAVKMARAAVTIVTASALAAGTAGVPPAAARTVLAGQPARQDQRAICSGPAGRAWPSFAYDPAHHDTVLFGGDSGSTVFGDTWTRRHGIWTQRHPALSPSPRTGAAMVYDGATGQLLLFGGSTLTGTGGGFLGDTWIWTGTTWRHLHPATSPSARHNADMIYDATTQNVVLFGGYDGHYLGDTWTWNGSSWTQQATPAAPAPRDTGSFVYDAVYSTGILYGGFNGIAPFTDTWAWTGTWTKLAPPSSPGPVSFAWDAAYDAATSQVILFGGGRTNHTNGRATWAWNGITWTRLSPATSPPGRGLGSMTYNSASRGITLFGGQGPRQDTYPTAVWGWDGSTWQRAAC